ncbi:hypothetical protein [Paenibacillus glucanolyticus]|uniref:hypothetical protein n=1 Tax=Paenibacillus glucanolyticus TaxID=59843 RepID=UPI00128B36B8|nr:hypothetical protein [Paenibacillus glucanolyticus]MPY20267.1 hypothetical protein [Paenibacillus glucanolyticus]
MNVVKERVSKAVFDQLENMMNYAEKDGDEGVAEHFRSLAYGLGAQMGVTGNPEHMPEFINSVIEMLGQGIQAGMQTAHGLNGRLSVQVYSVRKS